jgi:hypothetical protein
LKISIVDSRHMVVGPEGYEPSILRVRDAISRLHRIRFRAAKTRHGLAQLDVVGPVGFEPTAPVALAPADTGSFDVVLSSIN